MLEPEGETDTPETTASWSEVEGLPVNPDGEEGRHDRVYKRKVPEGKAKRQGKKVKRLRARKGKGFGWNPKKHRIM